MQDHRRGPVHQDPAPAPIAQRRKANQTRSDLRLVCLGLIVT